MRRMIVLVTAALALAGCSSSASKPAGAPAASVASVASTATPSAVRTTSEPSVAAETCATPLPDRGDIIE